MCTSSVQAFAGEPSAVKRAGTVDDIHGQVRNLLSNRFVLSDQEERRHCKRHPFPYLIRLFPVGEDGVTIIGEPTVVVGKQLSTNGLDFYHREPLAFRHAVASLQTRSGQWLSFLVELTWCRFTEFGWYDNGGRFLEVVELE